MENLFDDHTLLGIVEDVERVVNNQVYWINVGIRAKWVHTFFFCLYLLWVDRFPGIFIIVITWLIYLIIVRCRGFSEEAAIIDSIALSFRLYEPLTRKDFTECVRALLKKEDYIEHLREHNTGSARRACMIEKISRSWKLANYKKLLQMKL